MQPPTTLLGALAVTLSLSTAARGEHPFQDPNLPIEQRARNIVSLMTLQEKIDNLSTRPGVERLGIVGTSHVEGLHGLARGGPSNWGRRDPVPTTIFPQVVGLAQTWDPQLIQQVAAVEGYEARYIAQNAKYAGDRHSLVVRAPNADMARDPRWGRIEESFGEDPHLTGTMTAAFTRGLQGDHPRYWLTASLLKHFLANSTENDRAATSSDFDQRLLHEYYAVGFRRAIEDGGANAMMAAYNAVNGRPCTQHPLLRDLAMGRWGLDGIICSDGNGMHLTVDSGKHYDTYELAAAEAIKAGIGQFLEPHRDEVTGALEQGLLTEADLDDVLVGVFRVMIKLGMLDAPGDNPYAAIGADDEPEPWTTDKHKELARLVTRRSIVLLKNDEQTLPLDKEAGQSIAVIGRLGDLVIPDWYAGNAPYQITPLQGIRDKLGEDAKVAYHDGADLDGAAAAAQLADVAIVVVGNHPYGDADKWAHVTYPSYGREAADRESIYLEDERLVKKVTLANPHTILVLVSSFPYAINWSNRHVPAIVHLTHSSQETGSALADVLFGDANPGGKLVHTWPASQDQLPTMQDYDIRHGRTYMYFHGRPLYPFGYGLSYTTFDLANLRVSDAELPADGAVTVSVDLTNTGDRAGDEVIQLYVAYPDSAVARAPRQLQGFGRVTVEPGQTQTVQIPLQAKQLAYWDAQADQWVVERTGVQLRVGTSSAHTPLTTSITVTD